MCEFVPSCFCSPYFSLGVFSFYCIQNRDSKIQCFNKYLFLSSPSKRIFHFLTDFSLLVALFWPTVTLSLSQNCFVSSGPDCFSPEWRRCFLDEVWRKFWYFGLIYQLKTCFFEALPELISFWWQSFLFIVALTDCRYFSDLWIHFIPTFYHRICNRHFGQEWGNTCYHLFVEKHLCE